MNQLSDTFRRGMDGNNPFLTHLECAKGKVSIVILTKERLEHTKKCVKSIRRHTPQTHEIIFVDNSSTDGTIRWLQDQVKKNKNYRLIENHENAGSAKGRNQGISLSHGEYILLLDNEVIVSEDWLSGMLECLNRAPSTGIVGPMTNGVTGLQQVMDESYRALDYLDKYTAKFKEQNRYRRIHCRNIAGFCMLFKRTLAEKVGLFDERFDMAHFEDEDFCLRTELKGYQNFIAGDVFIHFHGNKESAAGRSIIEKKWTLSASSAAGKKLAVLKTREAADNFYSKGKIDQAVEALVNGIKVIPDAKEIYYELARIFIESKRFSEAWAIFETMPESAKSDLKGLFCAGYAKEGLGLDDEAAAYAEKILAVNNQSSAALNLCAVLAYKKGEKEKAVDYFQKAIDADPSYGEFHTNLGVLYWGMDKRDEALEHLRKGFILSPTVPDIGSLYYSVVSSLNIFSDAEADFREACRLYPNSKNLTFLYMDLLIQHGKFDSAMSRIEDAIVLFGLDDGILNAALAVREKIGPLQIGKASKKDTLSLCMIVKNEEQYLVQCLKSVRDVVDEIIIVDTGSTDRTIDIAKVFGAKVFDFPWTGDFSVARNHSLAQAKGDWIMVLDADEAISSLDFDQLKALIQKQTPTPLAYSIVTRNYINNRGAFAWTPNDGHYPEEAGSGWVPSPKVRLFKRNKDVFFSNPVHEILEDSLIKAKISFQPCDIIVHHYGKLDVDRDKKKGEDYYLMGKIKHESDPTNVKYIHELAKQAHTLNKFDETIELWLKLLCLTEADTQATGYTFTVSEIQTRLALAYLMLDRYEEALASAQRAMEGEVRQNEYVHVYAHCEIIAGSLQKAFHSLAELLKTTPDYAPALLLMAVIFSLVGKKEKAQELFQLLRQKGVQITTPLNQFAKQFRTHGKKDEALLILQATIENKLLDQETMKLLEELQKGL